MFRSLLPVVAGNPWSAPAHNPCTGEADKQSAFRRDVLALVSLQEAQAQVDAASRGLAQAQDDVEAAFALSPQPYPDACADAKQLVINAGLTQSCVMEACGDFGAAGEVVAVPCWSPLL